MPNTPLPVERTRAAILGLTSLYSGDNLTVGFVPTMGALHNGHLSLVRLAREHADIVVASIFVNPAQFAPGEDFDAYPRTENDDLEKLAQAGCDLAYCPSAAEMYPEGSVTDVRVPGLSDLLDGVYRPHFFYGVTTVVARLLLHVRPHLAVFGEKDFQQLQIIRRMVADLGFSVEILGGPTVRDSDGLAQSSRNRYLAPAERRKAGALHAALRRAKARILAGSTLETARAEAHAFLTHAGFTKVDYVSAVGSADLTDLPECRSEWPTETRVLGAAWLGQTRLIDNLPLTG